MSITTNYSVAYIYTKHTDLLQWFDINYSSQMSMGYQLLLVRFDGNKHYCKIKCPINPIPVKGEFETPSLGCIQKFLNNDGWRMERKIPISFLK